MPNNGNWTVKELGPTISGHSKVGRSARVALGVAIAVDRAAANVRDEREINKSEKKRKRGGWKDRKIGRVREQVCRGEEREK